MQIGNVKINGKCFLAPMAGANSTAFRIMCKKYGASLIYTQMHDVSRIIQKHSDGSLKSYLDIQNEERPVTIQLVGNYSDDWKLGCEILSKYANIIDINMGCSEPDYLGKKCGSYLMQQPKQAEKIIKECVAGSKVPVTIKIRSGWGDNNINAVEISKIAESLGVLAVAVHPRTRKQRYTGKADWKIIADVKKSIKIPVIGNGDIYLPGHAKAMIEQTKCDAVMIGREARKDPTIFERTEYLLNEGKNSDTEINKKKLIKEFIVLFTRYQQNGERKLNLLKDHISWLASDIKDAGFIKKRIRDCKNTKQLKALIDKIK